MVGTGGWLVRLGLFAVLGLMALMTVCRESEAAKYSVVQCGWGVGKDAAWGENAAQRYNHSALCVPSGSDVWSGVEIRTYTRPGAGSAAAATTGRWVWTAPADTAITNVRGTWWHQLHNNFQHRLGGMASNGNFQLSHSSSSSRGMQAFAAGFGSGVRTFESRLICARAEPKRCDTSPSSSAMVRALTLTLQDNHAPQVSTSGSALAGGWLRGNVEVSYAASDRGGGMRQAETTVDGARVGFTEHPCELAQVGGDWHGRKLRPCALNLSGRHVINTSALSDGTHSVRSCVNDFAGNRGCGATAQIRVDNNPPAAPLDLRSSGGEGWQRQASFDLNWNNPGQGAASPIVGATYRIVGPEGFESGDKYQAGNNISRLPGLVLPRTGEYTVSVRLHDQAGLSSVSNVARTAVRFDDVPPEVGFRGFSDVGMPERIRARVFDQHSGPAGGTITFRREGAANWSELPASVEPTGRPGEVDLVAKFPSETLAPGRYEFRVVGRDRAGNSAESNRRLDGGAMLAEGPLKSPTRLDARLEVGRQAGVFVSAGFLAQPRATGRLVEANGRALPGRELHVLVTPEAGSTSSASRYSLTTGENGEFQFQLGRSASRRVEIRFAGDDRLASSRAPDLSLRVNGEVSMRAKRERIRTGKVLRLSGRVGTRDAALPPEGKLVAVQYLDRRARLWRPVKFVRSDSHGRFWTRYRFRFISRRTLVRMRAVSLPEAGWPYGQAVSAPFNVRVLPKLKKPRKKKRSGSVRRLP